MLYFRADIPNCPLANANPSIKICKVFGLGEIGCCGIAQRCRKHICSKSSVVCSALDLEIHYHRARRQHQKIDGLTRILMSVIACMERKSRFAI